jgi:hypothetical protein
MELQQQLRFRFHQQLYGLPQFISTNSNGDDSHIGHFVEKV